MLLSVPASRRSPLKIQPQKLTFILEHLSFGRFATELTPPNVQLLHSFKLCTDQLQHDLLLVDFVRRQRRPNTHGSIMRHRLQHNGQILAVFIAQGHQAAAFLEESAAGQVLPAGSSELCGVGGGPQWVCDLVVATPRLVGGHQARPG